MLLASASVGPKFGIDAKRARCSPAAGRQLRLIAHARPGNRFDAPFDGRQLTSSARYFAELWLHEMSSATMCSPCWGWSLSDRRDAEGPRRRSVPPSLRLRLRNARALVPRLTPKIVPFTDTRQSGVAISRRPPRCLALRPSPCRAPGEPSCRSSVPKSSDRCARRFRHGPVAQTHHARDPLPVRISSPSAIDAPGVSAACARGRHTIQRSIERGHRGPRARRRKQAIEQGLHGVSSDSEHARRWPMGYSPRN